MNEKIIVKSNPKDVAGFAGLITTRLGKFKKAPDTPIQETYAVNETAKKLHPKEQKLTVKSVTVHGDDVKSYVLSSEDGSALAYFRAGQYLSVSLKVGCSYITRPYSISSTPERALDGEYVLTVKRTPGGFASDYILNNWKEGTPVSVSDPDGTFYYEPLRDAQNVIGIAGGSGITPFLSLAGAIADGTEDASLTLLYGCRTKNDILFKAEFDELCARSDKIKVVYVLSDSKAKGFEHGFITAELIKKYAPEKYSIFVCGPAAMYNFVGDEIKKLEIEQKYVRFELFAGAKPEQKKLDVFTCKVVTRDAKSYDIPCRSDESILVALERSGIKAPSKCRCGECGFCRSKLLDGEVFVPPETDGRRIADLKYGWIHPCCTFAESDITVRI